MNDQKRAASEEKIRYVEELAPAEEYEGDYWLTLTDAARVTKRQDKTIRDWVQQGKLPVRASDLAQLTPILDQTAAITTEAGQVYLTSIPGEMQQIRTTHEELLAEAARLQQEVERQGQTFQERLTTHQEQQERDLEALSTTWRQQWEQMSTQTQDAFEAQR
ncbi:hypothetical protein ccbrp13_13730 [Ktedonobacteria bacterium brp13]|nr:hypothetical protein ccbrp13_13730 [Ktedonobacteria bacterium brp13]